MCHFALGERFYGTQRSGTTFTSDRYLALSWVTSTQSTSSHSISWIYFLILSSNLWLGLKSGLFTSGSLTKILYEALRHTCHMLRLSHRCTPHASCKVFLWKVGFLLLIICPTMLHICPSVIMIHYDRCSWRFRARSHLTTVSKEGRSRTHGAFFVSLTEGLQTVLGHSMTSYRSSIAAQPTATHDVSSLITILLFARITGQAMYVQRNIEVRSCNHCYSGWAISITYSECVFLVLGIQHTMRMRHIVICVSFGSPIFFHTIS